MKKFIVLVTVLMTVLCSCNKEVTPEIPDGYGVVEVSVEVKSYLLTKGASAFDELPCSDYKKCNIKFGDVVWNQSNPKVILPEGKYAVTIDTKDCAMWDFFSNKVPFKSDLGTVTVKSGEISEVKLNLEYRPVSVVAVSKAVATASTSSMITASSSWYYCIMYYGRSSSATYTAVFDSISEDNFGFTLSAWGVNNNNRDVEFVPSGDTYYIPFSWKENMLFVIDKLPSKSGVIPSFSEPTKDITVVTLDVN